MRAFLLFLRGFLIGCADVVPGVSGGTLAFITGIYEELLAAEAASICPPRDPRAFAESVTRLISSEETRTRLAEAGRRYVEQELRPEVALEHYASMLEEVAR